MSYCRIILNALLLLLITPGLAIHTPAGINTTLESFEEEIDAYAQMSQGLPITYDGFLKLLHDIENDELEKRYDLKDLDQINHFLISCARQGLLPSDDAEELEADIEELLSQNAPSEFSLWIDDYYSIAPATLEGSFQTLFCKSFLQKVWKDTKKWVKKHKKPLIIAAAAATAAALTFGIAGAVTATAAAGAASAVGDSSDHKEAKDTKPIPFPSNGSSNEPSLLKSIYENELLSFKELIDREEFFDPKNTSFSLEEDGRVLRDAFIHQSLDVFQKEAASNPEFHRELHHIRQSSHPGASETIFSMNGFTYPLAKPSKGFDGNVYQLVDGHLYQMRGEHALELQAYDQAIRDFSKVIEENPNYPEAYLDRATAYLQSGDYERCLKDYQSYTAQKPAPLKYAYEFSSGFAKGLHKGVMESGHQIGSFARDVIIHPIDTATEVAQALATLSKLVYSQEWAALAETLAPEVCELATKWDTFSPQEQGDHAGHVFGKYGADILIPGASAKVLSKGIKGTKEVVTACKSFKKAEKTLAIESMAQSGGKFYRLAEGPVNSLENVSSVVYAGGRTARLENSIAKILGNSYKPIKEVTVPIKNTSLQNFLNTVSEGNWVKVYEAAMIDGNKVELHYFRNNTNRNVFDVKVKYDHFHQKEFKELMK